MEAAEGTMSFPLDILFFHHANQYCTHVYTEINILLYTCTLSLALIFFNHHNE